MHHVISFDKQNITLLMTWINYNCHGQKNKYSDKEVHITNLNCLPPRLPLGRHRGHEEGQRSPPPPEQLSSDRQYQTFYIFRHSTKQTSLIKLCQSDTVWEETSKSNIPNLCWTRWTDKWVKSKMFGIGRLTCLKVGTGSNTHFHTMGRGRFTSTNPFKLIYLIWKWSERHILYMFEALFQLVSLFPF